MAGCAPALSASTFSTAESARAPLSIGALRSFSAGLTPLNEFGPYAHAALRSRLDLAILQLGDLPHGLNRRKPIKRLRKSYKAALQTLAATDPAACSSQLGFEAIDGLLQVLPSQMAEIEMQGVSQGVYEVARSFRKGHPKTESSEYFGSDTQREIDEALANFNRSRIGLRLIGDSWRAARLEDQRPGANVRQRGSVQDRFSLVSEAKVAASYVTEIFLENVYACPPITIEHDEQCLHEVTYIPNHVWYGIIEVLKNACLASLVAHSQPGKPWTSITEGGIRTRFETRDGGAATAITISDDGFGIDNQELAFAYTFTDWKQDGHAPTWGLEMGGAGVGLPTVR